MPSAAIPPPQAPREPLGRRQNVYDTFDRTCSSASHHIFQQEADRIKKTQLHSQVLTMLSAIDQMFESLPKLQEVTANWNGHGSPAPSDLAVQTAQDILRSLRFSKALPEKAQASAEGGVALVYVGQETNRAVIEALNEEPPYVLLYNTNGSTLTIDWPSESEARSSVIKRLEAHLRGVPLAIDES